MEDRQMETSKTEKEWFRRINGQHPMTTDDKEAKTTDASVQHDQKTMIRKQGHGFNDVAGMDKLKQMVREGFVNVLQNRELADVYGIRPPSILFYGPAGCGKSFFAEKMAEEVGIHFIKVVPDDLACTWVHGTQQKIGEVFKDAEKNAPTLLFFDEFDAMVPRRTGDEANQHYDSEVNEFLCMLNNASDKGVYVLAATNHPERIDRAVLRTGRIDELIYVDMPDKDARMSLFSLELSKLPQDETIDTEQLANLTEGYNCSDITYIVKSAARKKFNEAINCRNGKLCQITQTQLEEIIARRSPSVNNRDIREYERLRSEFSPKDEGCKHVSIGFR